MNDLLIFGVWMMSDGVTLFLPKNKPLPTFWSGARFVGYTLVPLYDGEGNLLSLDDQIKAWS